MNLRQEIGDDKLNWQKLDSTADIKIIPFDKFSDVVVFVESDKDVVVLLEKMDRNYWNGNYIWFRSDGEYLAWDNSLDCYPLGNEDWNTIGTFYIPERKVAKML